MIALRRRQTGGESGGGLDDGSDAKSLCECGGARDERPLLIFANIIEANPTHQGIALPPPVSILVRRNSLPNAACLLKRFWIFRVVGKESAAEVEEKWREGGGRVEENKSRLFTSGCDWLSCGFCLKAFVGRHLLPAKKCCNLLAASVENSQF